MGRTRKRRRVVLGVAAISAVAVLMALAVTIHSSQSDARRTVERRFSYGSGAAASLVQTIVSQAYGSDSALARRTLSGRRLTSSALANVAGRSGSSTVLVLDARGRLGAAHPAGTSLAVGRRGYLRRAIAGQPAISDAVRVGRQRVIEIAVPFPSTAGRRVLVIRSPVGQVQHVLGPYLAGLPGLRGQRSYILDAQRHVLATGNTGKPRDPALMAALRTGTMNGQAAYANGRRHFSSAQIVGTPWATVDTVASSVLYSPLNGWHQALPWILLMTLLPATAVIVLLAERAGRAAEKAREASQAKSAFLASMSHELRTPMTTVIGFSEMLHQGKIGELSDRQHEVIGHIHSSSKHLNQLIGEVLDLSRVEEGRLTFHPEEVAPHRLIAEVANSMGGLAADRDVEIELDAPDIGLFHLDPARFKQVLYNLIGNAVKFTEARGRITVVLRREEHGELSVQVIDTGVGIRTEDLERIFLPFEQSGEHRMGAGLGLAVSLRIVDAQGGRIGVSSRLGEGTTFTVNLPPSP